MSEQKFSDEEKNKDFLALYRDFRYNNQLQYYTNRIKEYKNAQNQAIWCSIILIFLAAAAGAFESITTSWLRLTLLLIAAICPILSTTLAGYTALHGFTQQAKLFEDARRNLLNIHEPKILPNQQSEGATQKINNYVKQVENVLQSEHGFWGQMGESMTPPGL